MPWTRANYLTEARRAAEKEDDLDRYPDESLNRLFAIVLRSEWRRLLDLAPRHRVVTVGVQLGLGLSVSQPTLAGIGSVHRILSVMVNGQELPEVPDRGTDLTGVSPAPRPGWVWENETLLIRGLPVGTQLVIRASVVPALDETLATVDWPDEFAFVLVYELAGRMLIKGSVESGEAADQFRMADAERQKMMAVLRRAGMTPESVRPMDDASDWGGS